MSLSSRPAVGCMYGGSRRPLMELSFLMKRRGAVQEGFLCGQQGLWGWAGGPCPPAA